MSFNQQCEKEVLELHQALEDWLSGNATNADTTFARIVDVHASNFTYVTPEGEVISHELLFTGLKEAYSIKGKTFQIKIENLRTVAATDELCAVTYEEWHSLPETLTRRQSTAIFRKKPGNPSGAQWVHIQETWLADDRASTSS